jgi:hypothetical protein
MLTRILAVVVAFLALLVVHQYNRVGEMRAEIASAEQRAAAEARSVAAESMEGQGAEIQRTLQWLNDFYRSSDGLQRPEGLWISGRPDFEGISAWVFDVYLRNRLRGMSEDQARQTVEDAIKQSDEWRVKHHS